MPVKYPNLYGCFYFTLLSFSFVCVQKGYTPLLVACEYQHKDMVEYLLSLPDVDPSASTSMDGSGEGNTGLHIAAIHDSPEIAKLLIDRCPTAVFNKEVKLLPGIYMYFTCIIGILSVRE